MLRAFALLISLCLLPAAVADDWPRFRGPKGDGHSAEKGLLQRWPADGPRKLWATGGLGKGWTSAAVHKGKIYTTGMELGKGYLHCFDLQGKQLWKVGYGREWDGPGKWIYPGVHSTPTLDGDRLYLMSSYGVISCASAETGKRIWAVDTFEVFGGRNIKWGISESPLIDGDAVYISPGGPQAAVVKLDKLTGKTIWKCDTDQKTAYCSPIMLHVGKGKLLVTMLEDGMVGIDPANGKLLWEEQFSNQSLIHANTPLLSASGYLFCCIGSGEGAVAVKLSDDGRKKTAAWDARVMDTGYGNNVMIGDHVYGTSSRRPKARLLCVEVKTGKIAAQSRAVGMGSLITAEGLLYVYDYKGKVALISASPQKLELRGEFEVADGSGEHWAHPSIANGVLYIRHGSHLVAYDIRKK